MSGHDKAWIRCFFKTDSVLLRDKRDEEEENEGKMALVYASLARQVFEKSRDLKSKGLKEEVRELLSLSL